MKNFILIAALLLSITSISFAANSDGSGTSPNSIETYCMNLIKATNDGSGNKATNDGSGNKATNDGSGNKATNDGSGNKAFLYFECVNSFK